MAADVLSEVLSAVRLTGSVFFDVIVGASDYADGKAQTISGIKTDDNTGDITITLTEPNGTFENVLGLMFAAPVPPSTPLDKDSTNKPPPASGPFMISKVDAPRTLTMERNPNFQTVKDAGATEVHFRITSPPYAHSCFYGVDTPNTDELLAHRMDVEEMRKFVGADSLAFISTDGLYRAMGEGKRNAEKPQFCDACFSGDYPIALTDLTGGAKTRQLSLLSNVA